MTTIESATGRFDRPRRHDKVIQMPRLPQAVRESAARAMNEPRFQTQAASAPAQPVPAFDPHLPAPASTGSRTSLVAACSMCVGALLMYAWMTGQRNDGANALDTSRAEVASPTGLNSTAAAAMVAPAQSAPPVASLDERSQAAAMVAQWAAAWSERDVERYLGFYAKQFVPPDSLSRDAWQEKRRERILGKQRILVTVEDLGIELLEDNRAIARFAQTYEADKYREARAGKTLILAREDGAWRIAAEVNSRETAPQKR